ncbi:MAG TPA: cobyric acid synthase [Alphaproteobacteria bacterium]|nr:cobyric acid synthase [Alphaproteobacteria bacterium]
MLQGTGSDVGKSLLVAGLARALTGRGLRVRPFKPQNMSNNAAVSADGGEIGRAQALQARACGVPASVHMNPVLLKPQTEIGAQLVVQGRVEGTVAASAYRERKPQLLRRVMESFARLASEADLVLVEGAGSPAEINLRAGDIANMGFAAAADVPVVLVGDIDRGGVIASLVGTMAVLEPDEKARIRGFLVNKFRGDALLFADGRAEIARRTGLADLGLVPWFEDAVRLPAEDAAGLDSRTYALRAAASRNDRLKIVVPHLPRIANFDDLDPLAAEPGVMLEVRALAHVLPADADVVLLPGSKATLSDLGALRQAGWDIDLLAHARRGGHVIGLCGGYQMLGRNIADPNGIEGPARTAPGLGLLEVDTILEPHKILRERRAQDARSGTPIRGYEIHIGRTTGPGCAQPFLVLDGQAEGAVSRDQRIEGCYIHGLFTSDAFRRAWLDRVRAARGLSHSDTAIAYDASLDAVLDRLADHVAASVDLDCILEIARAR